jgi:hypothetical protein
MANKRNKKAALPNDMTNVSHALVAMTYHAKAHKRTNAHKVTASSTLLRTVSGSRYADRILTQSRASFLWLVDVSLLWHISLLP